VADGIASKRARSRTYAKKEPPRGNGPTTGLRYGTGAYCPGQRKRKMYKKLDETQLQKPDRGNLQGRRLEGCLSIPGKRLASPAKKKPEWN